MKSFFKNLLIPNKDNEFKPKILKNKSFTAFVILVFLFEIFFLSFYFINYENNFSSLSAVFSGVLINKTNEEREDRSLNLLEENEKLNQAAKLKADDMASRGYFAHVSPDGKTPWYWIQEVKYDYEFAGENLAVNFRDSSRVHNAWMKSESHRENILRDGFTEIGIATSVGEYKGKDATFVVQYFAKPKSQTINNISNFNQGGAVSLISFEKIKLLFLEIISSPILLSDFILIFVSILITVFLVLKIFIKYKIQHKKLIINGLVLILIMLLLMLINRYVFNYII